MSNDLMERTQLMSSLSTHLTDEYPNEPKTTCNANHADVKDETPKTIFLGLDITIGHDYSFQK